MGIEDKIMVEGDTLLDYWTRVRQRCLYPFIFSRVDKKHREK
jgi:hypothetical protein